MAQSTSNIKIDHRSKVPLYEQICQHFRDKIEASQLKPGTSLPTNHELRNQLRVNYKTAQQAMATLAKEGYVTRQARRGTIVKGIPRRGVVGIYLWNELFDQDIKHEYYRLIARHLSQQLEDHGRVYRIYLDSKTPEGCNTAGDDLLRHLSGGTLCGALMLNPFSRLEELVCSSRALHVPVVSLLGLSGVDYSVLVDFAGYVRNAVDYLKQQGRRRVGVIYHSASIAFREAGIAIPRILEENGYTPKASWIVGGIATKEGIATEEGGYVAAASMPLNELDGLIVLDDVMARGVGRRLREQGVKMPRDLIATTIWHHSSRMSLAMPFERFELDAANQACLCLQLVQDVIDGQRILEPHRKVVPAHSSTRRPGVSAQIVS